jgi:hypothetical protein
MRILVTGSRHWSDAQAVRLTLQAFNAPNNTLVSGACPTGADALAEQVATEFGWTIERHPADWATKHRAAGPIRNEEMAALGADVCIAFLAPDSRGTKDMVTRARAHGIPVHEVASD